jgi:D-3-phosphoglycerate dehydrogenase
MEKILITTSSFGIESAEPLDMTRKAGFAVVLNPYRRKLTEAELIALLSEHRPRYLIAGTEAVSRRVMETARPFLRMISRCGSGVDNVDLSAAAEIGIRVVNTPDAPTRAVAELTVGIMIDLLRGISNADRAMRNGKFDKYMGGLLFGRTVGLVGCGRIGTAVAKLLSAFGCRVIGYDEHVKTHDFIEPVAFDELLKTSDVISLHIPYTDENKHFIDAEAIAGFKDGAIFLNLSRGGLVDENALCSALKSGKVKAAGMDCFEDEPYSGGLTELTNVVLTPHIGSYARETRVEQELTAVRRILEYDNDV